MLFVGSASADAIPPPDPKQYPTLRVPSSLRVFVVVPPRSDAIGPHPTHQIPILFEPNHQLPVSYSDPNPSKEPPMTRLSLLTIAILSLILTPRAFAAGSF